MYGGGVIIRWTEADCGPRPTAIPLLGEKQPFPWDCGACWDKGCMWQMAYDINRHDGLSGGDSKEVVEIRKVTLYLNPIMRRNLNLQGWLSINTKPSPKQFSSVGRERSKD
jgi:hypothetical protein